MRLHKASSTPQVPQGIYKTKVAWGQEGIVSRSGLKTRGHLKHHRQLLSFPPIFSGRESILEGFLFIKFFRIEFRNFRGRFYPLMTKSETFTPFSYLGSYYLYNSGFLKGLFRRWWFLFFFFFFLFLPILCFSIFSPFLSYIYFPFLNERDDFSILTHSTLALWIGEEERAEQVIREGGLPLFLN